MSKRQRGIPQAEKERRRNLRRRLHIEAAAGNAEEVKRIKDALMEIERRRLSIRWGLQRGHKEDELGAGWSHQKIGIQK